ncbi:hypothetical protein D3C76_1186920 [compost metagenome]
MEDFVEYNCKDTNSQSEWIKIRELEILEGNIEASIKDYIYNIRKYRLENKMHTIKKKLKESEDKGVFEDLINLAKELKNVDLELKRLKRG